MTAKIARHAIEGELTIYTAATLRQQLLEWLAEAERLEIDLSRVSEADTAGIQLLVAAKHEAGRRNRELLLTGHARPVVDLMDLFDLGSFFGDQMVIVSRTL